MSIIKFDSKNVKTAALLSLIAFLGTFLAVILNRYDHFSPDSGLENPYLIALQPLLFAGVPMMMLIAFIVSVFAAAREESATARAQAIFLMIALVIMAYSFSFMMFSSGF